MGKLFSSFKRIPIYRQKPNKEIPLTNDNRVDNGDDSIEQLTSTPANR